jgi:hypothetical protein
VHLFGRQQRKPRVEVEPHLVPENRPRPCARPVPPVGPVVNHVAEKVEILAHRLIILDSNPLWHMVQGAMSKGISKNALDGRFVVGRRSAEKFNAVEGLHHTAKTGRLASEADRRQLSGEARRAQIRAEFAKK